MGNAPDPGTWSACSWRPASAAWPARRPADRFGSCATRGQSFISKSSSGFATSRYSGGRRRDGPFQIAHRGKMLIQALDIALRQVLLQQIRILVAPRPECCACDRSSLGPAPRTGGRKADAGSPPGASGRSGPAQLMFLWMALPKHSCETPTCSERKRDWPANLCAMHLIHRRPAGTAPGEVGARHQRAHGSGVAVARSIADGGVVEAAQDVDLIPQPRQRSQARRQIVIGARLVGNPIAFRDAVAVEPEDKTPVERKRLVRRIDRGCVSRAAGVEHREQRRQAHHTGAPDRTPCKSDRRDNLPCLWMGNDMRDPFRGLKIPVL